MLYALAAIALAHVHSAPLLAVAMLATGVAWISILSALQVSDDVLHAERFIFR